MLHGTRGLAYVYFDRGLTHAAALDPLRRASLHSVHGWPEWSSRCEERGSPGWLRLESHPLEHRSASATSMAQCSMTGSWPHGSHAGVFGLSDVSGMGRSSPDSATHQTHVPRHRDTTSAPQSHPSEALGPCSLSARPLCSCPTSPRQEEAGGGRRPGERCKGATSSQFRPRFCVGDATCNRSIRSRPLTKPSIIEPVPGCRQAPPCCVFW
ncbi:hypothetical protein B0H67DRAFT_99426 [Lasiosphaeris hirsuta]|uniref:Uncharacterized protein n=1 Tax=Lasiosphaeris hirsuta TaxID=260670 RepID=A0AA40AY28_9PEZI|nr:hypothetical protein B0H67DRAFT_99426 [Lasiosphaeris hirsuta]